MGNIIYIDSRSRNLHGSILESSKGDLDFDLDI